MALKFDINVRDPFTQLGVSHKIIVTQALIAKIRSDQFNIPGTEVEEPIDRSDYDTPVLDNLSFPAGKYIDLQGNEIDFAGITLNAILLEVTQPKNIIKTPVQGRNGTVKEYISDGDYKISGRGLISNFDNVLPLDDLRIFRQIMNVPQQLEIVSQYLNEVYDIFQIVIEDYNMPQIEGVRNQIPFNFTASSDVPLDLEELAV